MQCKKLDNYILTKNKYEIATQIHPILSET